MVQTKKEPVPRLVPLMLALPIFPGRPTYCPDAETLQWSVSGRICISIRKEPADWLVLSVVLALPIFPGSRPPSIVGVHELNFCVRDGNRWTLMTINTNYDRWLFTILMSNSFSLSNRFRILAHLTALVNPFLQDLGDPYRIRTDVKGVRGLCLNHLTNGPWCAFRDSNPGPTD